MGHFDSLSAGNFKKDADGNTVFFPWGFFRKGRVITDVITETQVRNLLNRYYKVTFFGTIILASIVKWWALSLVPVLWVWYYMSMKSILKDCSYSEIKLSYMEALKENFLNQVNAYSKIKLWLVFLVSSMFVLAEIFIMFNDKNIEKIIYHAGGAVFFGIGMILFGYMLIVKYTPTKR